MPYEVWNPAAIRGKEVLWKTELPTLADVLQAAEQEFPSIPKEGLEIAANDLDEHRGHVTILREKR